MTLYGITIIALAIIAFASGLPAIGSAGLLIGAALCALDLQA